jgi:hypothetical protein
MTDRAFTNDGSRSDPSRAIERPAGKSIAMGLNIVWLNA